MKDSNLIDNNLIQNLKIKFHKGSGNLINSNINNKKSKIKPKNLKLSKTNKDFFYINKKIKKNNMNKEYTENNAESMSEILNKLIKIKNKMNDINYSNKKMIIGLFKPYKSFKKEKILSKSNTKNKYLLYINDYYKNKRQLLLQKNKTITYDEDNPNKNFNNIHSESNINYKTSNTINDSNNKIEKFNSLDEIKVNNSFSKLKKKKINKIHFFDKTTNNIAISNNTNSFRKSFYFKEKNKEKIKVNKIMHNHIKYIEKIKDNELLDLINRYKKSLSKNKQEENFHFRSLVFPAPLINYLIQMKRELIIDKYRNEYLNKLDRYNTHNILSAIKNNKNYIKEKIIYKEDVKKENENINNKPKTIQFILNNDKK